MTVRIKHIKSITLLIALWAAFQSQASLIAHATSDLDLRHSYRVNNGSVPEGIRLSTIPSSLVIEGSASSEVDLESASNVDTINVVVGNPFSDPVIPFQAQRSNRTSFNGGIEGAQGELDVSIRNSRGPDPEPTVASITERSIDNTGRAEAILFTQDVLAHAESFYTVERSYRFENLSNDRIQFNIVGNVNFDLLSEYESDMIAGGMGAAGTSFNVYTLFDLAQGASVLFEQTSVYDPNISILGLGAMTSDTLEINPDGKDGFSYSASASAISGAGEAMASISELFTYRFAISMEAGSTLDFRTGFTQNNFAHYMPESVEVSSPASIGLITLGLLCMFCRTKSNWVK